MVNGVIGVHMEHALERAMAVVRNEPDNATTLHQLMAERTALEIKSRQENAAQKHAQVIALK